MARIAYFSDYDLAGSGYLNISVPLCNELTKLGHEVKAIGLGYHGQEHDNLFSIIPCQDFNDFNAIVQNLTKKWPFDVFMVALDIPHHERILSMPVFQQRKFKYIGIMPVEAGPVCISWAIVLSLMDKCFIISEYGTQQAKEVGVNAEHLQVGVDTKEWHPVTPEEKQKLREALGIDKDVFVVLTVADNQERKNPHRLIETFAGFAQNKKAKYILVTREFNPAGGKLRDYAQEKGIQQNFMLFERGMAHKQLFGLYAMSDAFLLCSKSEGLGMPILEAMAMGTPVVATNCTAISELLADGRGLLVDYDYQHRDCFGNGWRYWFSKDKGVEKLNQIYDFGFDASLAREYVEKRTWDIPAKQVNEAIKGILGT